MLLQKDIGVDEPYVLQRSDRMQLWLAERKVATSLTFFSGQYKKSKECVSKGRVQFPL